MSDHFDHYKRPPSRDNSVDRYSRAASRLSGGSRQSSVEKSQNQQQQRRGGDDRLPSSSSSAADKSFSGGAGFTAASAAGAKQNTSSSAATQRQPPPFEEIILRQRNLGQEIVPSPIGQPKRTESLYVNPNTARKETKPKVSTTSIPRRSRSNSLDNGDGQSSYGGSVGSGRSNHSYSSPRGSNVGCCCFICHRSKNIHDDSVIVDSHGRHAMRSNSGCRINISTSDGNARGSGDGRDIMDSGGGGIYMDSGGGGTYMDSGGGGDIMDSDHSGVNEGNCDGRVSRISGYIFAVRGRGVGCSRSNSTDNYGSRINGDGLDSTIGADERSNMISGDSRPSRSSGNRGSSRGRGEGRSNSGSTDGRATSNTIPLNSSNGHSSGNTASANSSIIRHSRSRSGLRVRFSEEVSSSDDPPGRGGGSNSGLNHIRSNRHSSHDSYFNSRDSNQVTTSVAVGRQTREISHTQIVGNMLNVQISTNENRSNIGGYGSDDFRRNLDDHTDGGNSHITRFGGYESGGVCCRNDVYVSNSTRDISVVQDRSSIRGGNGGGRITDDMRGISGVYVSSSGVHDYGDHHVRGVVIREISNSGGDSGQCSGQVSGQGSGQVSGQGSGQANGQANGQASGQGSGQGNYEYNYDYEGFYNYPDDYDVVDNYGIEGGGSVGDRRIRRLLPSLPLIQRILWFKSYLNNNHGNYIFYHQ